MIDQLVDVQHEVVMDISVNSSRIDLMDVVLSGKEIIRFAGVMVAFSVDILTRACTIVVFDAMIALEVVLLALRAVGFWVALMIELLA